MSDLVPMSPMAFDVLRQELAKLPPKTVMFWAPADDAVQMREDEAVACARQMGLTLPEYFAECEAKLGIKVTLGA